MINRILAIILFSFLSYVPVAYADMAGADFQIKADAIGVGGDNSSSGGSYQLRDTIAGLGGGNTSSSLYNLRAGLRPMIFDEIVTIDLAVQETGTGQVATGLASTVISTAATGSFSVGNYVILVQDEATTHAVAIGRVVSIVPNASITVDELVSNAVITIDGVDDTLYRANGSSVDYGTLTTGSVTHRMVGWEVTSDTPNGLNVYVAEDGELRDGVNDVNDVADGAVSAGSEEFGARSSDTTLTDSTFDTADTGVTTTPQQVGSVSGTVFASKGVLHLKASIGSSTQEGNYAHDLSIIVAPVY